MLLGDPTTICASAADGPAHGSCTSGQRIRSYEDRQVLPSARFIVTIVWQMPTDIANRITLAHTGFMPASSPAAAAGWLLVMLTPLAADAGCCGTAVVCSARCLQ